ncbi:MAG: DUF1269 domain-containing protein [Acidimicrobiales bacterium]|nr:MAG: DUF1269 domain-containing protein [Acidimicrobiales bacterium]
MTDVHGPIDFVLLEFTGGNDLSATAAALIDLVERGVVRLYDLLAIRKEEDGTFSMVELDALGGEMTVVAGARSGLLGDDDMQAAADTMLPGTTGVLLMYENTWAIPFVAAAFDAGGTMVASKRIPAEEVIAVLDELEAAD